MSAIASAWAPDARVEFGVGYDGVDGSADGAATGVSWQSVLPRVSLRWKQSEASHFHVDRGLSPIRGPVDLRHARRGRSGSLRARTSRSGPPPPSARLSSAWVQAQAVSQASARSIPSLRRPLTDEIVAGIDAQLSPNIRGRITGVAKKLRNLFDLADIGAPASSYTTFTVVDGRPEADGGDVLLPLYNRLPATFGADRYLLTNRTNQDTATAAALILNSDATLKQLTLMFNATTSITDGPAASRGFRAEENNLGSLGELSIDPNSAPIARGRLFYDRAFTMKISACTDSPARRHARRDRAVSGRPAVLARHGRAEPQSRAPNSCARMPPETRDSSYTGTLDVRVQKRVTMGAVAVAAFVDAYNRPTWATRSRSASSPAGRRSATSPPSSRR